LGDDRDRIARFGGERHDVPMGERVGRFVEALVVRLRREPGIAVDVTRAGEPAQEVVLTVEAAADAGALAARLGYAAGAGEHAFDGYAVLVGSPPDIVRHFEQILRSVCERHPGVADYEGFEKGARHDDVGASGIRFALHRPFDGSGELAFLFVRDLGRALPVLARLLSPPDEAGSAGA